MRAKMRPRGTQERPRGAQERPKRAQEVRGAQQAPRGAQKAPNRGQRRLSDVGVVREHAASATAANFAPAGGTAVEWAAGAQLVLPRGCPGAKTMAYTARAARMAKVAKVARAVKAGIQAAAAAGGAKAPGAVGAVRAVAGAEKVAQRAITEAQCRHLCRARIISITGGASAMSGAAARCGRRHRRHRRPPKRGSR